MRENDALDIRTERLANQAVAPGTLASQTGSAQADRVEITQIISSAGVSSLAGTLNQVTVSAPTGSVTVSLPQNIHTGATPTFAGLVISAAGRPSVKVTTPAQIVADTNNYNPGPGGFFRIITDASRNLTGIVAGVDGAIIRLRNAGSFNFVLTNQDAASTAANRIITGTGASVTYAPDDIAELIYDITDARWILML